MHQSSPRVTAMERRPPENDLRAHARSEAAGPDCPDPMQLATALDGQLEPSQREFFDLHVSSCSHCVARLGQLARLKALDADATVPDTTMARARRLVGRRVPLRAAGWAAAAMVVLAVVLTAPELDDAVDPSLNQAPPARQARNIDPDGMRPRVLAPDEGARLSWDGARFKWTEVPGSLHYDIRVVSDDGAMLWQERVQGTEWRAVEALSLVPGQEYYFRVDAYLTQAKRVSSEHRLFTVEEPR